MLADSCPPIECFAFERARESVSGRFDYYLTGRGALPDAAIVPEGEPPTGALRRFCWEWRATDKVPRVWKFRDALPRSGLGKVLRHRL